MEKSRVQTVWKNLWGFSVAQRWRIRRTEDCEGPGDPWGFEIVTRTGSIYLFGGDLWCVDVRRGCRAARWACEKLGLELFADADDFTVFRFPRERLPEVSKAVGAKPKRVLSPEQEAACVERLAKARLARKS